MYRDRILTLTIHQVAEYCNVDKQTVTKWAEKGKIPSHRLGEWDIEELGVNLGNAPLCISETKRNLDKLKSK